MHRHFLMTKQRIRPLYADYTSVLNKHAVAFHVEYRPKQTVERYRTLCVNKLCVYYAQKNIPCVDEAYASMRPVAKRIPHRRAARALLGDRTKPVFIVKRNCRRRTAVLRNAHALNHMRRRCRRVVNLANFHAYFIHTLRPFYDICIV